MNFYDKIERACEKNDSLVCIGLDPDLTKVPEYFKNFGKGVLWFNKRIIDATADLVCAYKPQVAYYSAFGFESYLELTIEYIHEEYPDIPVILDAKRNDIGSTAEMYAREVFGRYGADAVTVNPYMGGDTLMPYLDCKNKGVIVLCKTSNPGSKDIQDLEYNGKKLYRIVAEKAVNEWNYNNNVLLVVGATYPDELREIRTIVGNMPLLIPGVGAQGGDIELVVTNGKNMYRKGVMINSSRAIIYAGIKEKTIEAYCEEVRKAAMVLRDSINRYR